MTKLSLIAITFLVGACATDATSAEDTDLTQPVAERCSVLEGRVFFNHVQYDCGPRPAEDAGEACSWSVKFSELTDAESELMYFHSDTPDAQTVSCAQGVITGANGAQGTYDLNASTVTWDGIVFTSESR